MFYLGEGWGVEVGMRMRIMRFHAVMRICGCSCGYMRTYYAEIRILIFADMRMSFQNRICTHIFKQIQAFVFQN